MQIDVDLNREIIERLATTSSMPRAAIILWAEALRHVDPQTCEIRATREELGRLIHVGPNDISRLVTDLAKCNVMHRQQVYEQTKKGSGGVKYYLDRDLWHRILHGNSDVKCQDRYSIDADQNRSNAAKRRPAVLKRATKSRSQAAE